MKSTSLFIVMFLVVFLSDNRFVFSRDSTEVKTDMVNYPVVFFGLSVSSYDPDFSKIGNAFKAIENYYKEQGYYVPYNQESYGMSSVTWLVLGIDLPAHFSIKGDLSIVKSGLEFRAVSVSLLYRFNKEELSWFQPYAGCGIGDYNFKLSKIYNVPLKYSTLESVDITGGGFGFNINAGLELKAGNVAGLNLFAEYLFVKNIESTAADGSIYSVSLSSLMFGCGILFFLE